MIVIIVEDEPCGCKAPLGKRLAPETEWGSRPPSSATFNPSISLFQFFAIGSIIGIMNILDSDYRWENFIVIASTIIFGYVEIWPIIKEKSPSVK